MGRDAALIVERELGYELEDWGTVDQKYKAAFGKDRPDIRHIVVLMLENRTFDGCQGHYMNKKYKRGEVKRSKWDTDGKDLYEYTNAVQGPDPENGPVDFPVWSVAKDDETMMSQNNLSVPKGPAGPVEKFHFLNKCTYGVLRPTPEDIKKGPDMAGFASEYLKKEKANSPSNADGETVNADGSPLIPGIAATDFKNKRSPVMHVYRPEQMTVFTQLMDAFGCSDCHFSSAPCQTWPNRLFAACGTCFGYYNNIPYVNKTAEADGGKDETHYFQSEEVHKGGSIDKMASSYDTDTVFHKLEQHGVQWAIYHGQVSLAVLTTSLKWHLSLIDRVKTLDDFETDVRRNRLPSFVWLEPNYDAEGTPNDMHPPANVLFGQKLIRDVYHTLRSKQDIWDHTLFIVTTDEGVGSFDHVKPPAAADPVVGHDHEYVFQDDGSPADMIKAGHTNPFTRFGTRVPNLLISPWISKGSVVRPKDHDVEGECPYPFDHTSIIRTAFDLLLGRPDMHLTERDKVAPSFACALDLDAPLNQGPEQVLVPRFDEKPLPKGHRHACHSVPFLVEACRHTDSFGGQLHSGIAHRLAGLLGVL